MTAAKPTPVDHTLPDGWQRVRLGGICSPPQYGASAPARDYDPKLPRYVRITDITDHGRLRVDDPKSADPDKVKGYELEPGDLLFARSGSVGRTYLHRPEDGKCVYAGYLIRFRALPNIAAPEYLEHCTHSSVYFNWISSIARRGAQTNVNATEYSSLPILLPPLPEQRAIAAVLDSIDDAIEGAEAVIAATEGLRDALLHDLLTRGLPGQHTEFREVPGLGTIPADWDVVRLGDVAEVQTGRAVKKGTPVDGALEVPYLCVANVKDGYLDLTSVKSMRVSSVEIDRYGLREGDVLFTEGGDADKLGRGTVWRNEIPVCIHQNHIFAVRPNREVLMAEFLSAFATSGFGKRYFLGAAKQTTNLASVNSTQLKQMTLGLPNIQDQGKIVGALSATGISIVEATIERNNLRLLKASTADALLAGRVRVGVGANV